MKSETSSIISVIAFSWVLHFLNKRDLLAENVHARASKHYWTSNIQKDRFEQSIWNLEARKTQPLLVFTYSVLKLNYKSHLKKKITLFICVLWLTMREQVS